MAYGISNSFKRGTIKTYSRPLKRVHEDDDNDSDLDLPIKRIRMDHTGNIVVEETVGGTNPKASLATRENEEIAPGSSTAPSSSPQRRDGALCSSDAPAAGDDASPPSSPPPARLPSPVAQSRKPAFAFLKRKRPGSAVPDGSAGREHEPLAEMAENVGAAAAEKAESRKRKGKLTQMQIDLGGEVRKACKTCGMDYIPSNAEDAGLHKKFHAMNVGGVGIRKGCLREMKKRRVVDVGERRLDEGHAVVVVDGRGSSSVRYEAKRVLEVVNTELSAVGIEDKELWGQAPGPVTAKGKSVRRRGKDKYPLMEGGDRFKVYLYLDRDTCVGLCLAEKIEHAYRVVNSHADDHAPKEMASLPRSSSISTNETAEAALLGVSRIWTSTSHRRNGIAAALLDAARRNFFYGMEVPKDKMAFSQPTESGGQLAEYWFDAPAGWLVYAEAY
ncbi:MAG: sister chromatid cohesion acetyltransferase Eco1 [Lasallia pustulata]|uniref:Sister chromatid cohesion acetyltransferase Eco1 n=1 Tax=Lasallia pustulata TaxID=136370 RepID=A0A5M8PSQ2_9LECA|nr:MAG: sister chromatid cohesion acetyltransferase Eco1 [Lasallia pustulata]